MPPHWYHSEFIERSVVACIVRHVSEAIRRWFEALVGEVDTKMKWQESVRPGAHEALARVVIKSL